MVTEVGPALRDWGGVRPVVDPVRARLRPATERRPGAGTERVPAPDQRIDRIGPQLTEQRAMFPEAEQSLHPRRIEVQHAPEGVRVGNLADRDAHLVPLRGRISELERGSGSTLQRSRGAAPDYGDRLVAGGRFGGSEATVDQDIKMAAVQGLERVGENGGDVGYEEHGCHRAAVDMHLLEVLTRLLYTDHHRGEYSGDADRGQQDVTKQPL